MRSCLCCQGPEPEESGYHGSCLKALFGKPLLPGIPFRKDDLPIQIRKLAGRMSLSGVQIKASMKIEPTTWEMEIVAVGGTHILKPEPDGYPNLPQNENLCMNIAAELGMRVPPHGLFKMKDGAWFYVVKRFDRKNDGGKVHKETMYQILSSREKYAGSLEQVGQAIMKHTKFAGLDSVDFFERVILCFLIGNGDMHMKNWAHLLDETIGGRLAPCYDFVSTWVYLEDEDSALTLNGKKNKLKREDFDKLAAVLQLDPRAAENSYTKFIEGKSRVLEMADSSEMISADKLKFRDLVNQRYKRLFS